MAKQKGELEMGGTLDVQLTQGTLQDLLNGNQVMIGTGVAMEFYLAVKAGDKDSIVRFTPWFDAADCKLSIGNSTAKDDSFDDAICINLVDTENRSVSIQVNADQAEALAGVLNHYVQAWKALELLRADCPVA